jgi:cytoskeletal protein CcmA (bactofilin family)
MFFNSWKRKKAGSDYKKSTGREIKNGSIQQGEEKKLFKNEVSGISPSLLGKEIKINGKVTTTGELQIDGIIEGEIEALKLVIEQSAKIIGSVSSEDLVIKGRIIGPVYGKKVRFGATARVEGDTFHETIAIEDGAYYEGSIKRHISKSFLSKATKNKSSN